MTEKEKTLRAFGFKPVEDPELIEVNRKEDEKVANQVAPIIAALIDWRKRSRDEIVAYV